MHAIYFIDLGFFFHMYTRILMDYGIEYLLVSVDLYYTFS